MSENDHLPNGSADPQRERLASIANLAGALSSGSAKLCDALSIVLGDSDHRSVRAGQLDLQIQPLMKELIELPKAPNA